MNRLPSLLTVLLGLLLVGAPAGLAQDYDTDTPTIAELAMETDALSTLVTAVQAADLVGALQGEGPLTVFAPTNDAFAALPDGTLETLTEPDNQSQLQGILKYHVVPGLYTAADLEDGQMLTTLAGDELEVNFTDEGVLIGGATVVNADVMASNGVMHVIDHVLLSPHDTGDMALRQQEDAMPATEMGGGVDNPDMPMTDDGMDTDPEMESDMRTGQDATMSQDGMMEDEGMDGTAVQTSFTYTPGHFVETRTIPQNLVTADNFDMLVQAVEAAGLAEALSAEGPYTIFAPINSAFEKVDGAMMTALLEPSNQETLQDVLTYHVVEGRIEAGDLQDGMQVETLSGRTLTVYANDDSPTRWNVDGGDILVADLPASNGLIHVVDLVLLPDDITLEGNTSD